MDSLQQLKLLKFSECCPNDIREILYINGKIPFISFTIHPGVFIIRSRKGLFNEKEDLTYCPKKYCNTYKRASLPESTVFYGVISDDPSHQENARAISISEGSLLIRGGNNTKGIEHFSCAQWKSIKPLHVASFVTDISFPDVQDNLLLNQCRDSFNRFAVQNSLSPCTLNTMRFLDGEFNKKVDEATEYLISATISHDIINDLKLDGVIYPSVQLGGQAGLNIALSPQSVDSKLSFQRIMHLTNYKFYGQSFVCLRKIIENKMVHEYTPLQDSLIMSILGMKSKNEWPLKEV